MTLNALVLQTTAPSWSVADALCASPTAATARLGTHSWALVQLVPSPMRTYHRRRFMSVISREIVDFLGGGVSLLIGSRDAQLRPACGRLVGIRVEAIRDRVSVYIPEATSETVLANLRDNGRVAVMASQPLDHRSIQIKGELVRIESALASECPLLDAYVMRLSSVLDPLGVPANLVQRINHWPAWRITFVAQEVYLQTPGPGAGMRLSGAQQ